MEGPIPLLLAQAAAPGLSIPVPQQAATAAASLGLLGVCLALAGYGCAGAFTVVAKSRAARVGRPLHPFSATLLGSLAILLLGLPLGLLDADHRLQWPSAYGLLGGAVWAPGKMAIVWCTLGRGGLGVATATTSGCAVLASVVAGLLVLGEPWGGPMALACIALMLAGIAGLAAAREWGRPDKAPGGETAHRDSNIPAAFSGQDAASADLAAPMVPKPPMACQMLLEMGACAVGGVGVGCSTMPLLFDPAKDSRKYLAGYCLGQFTLIAWAVASWRLWLSGWGGRRGGAAPPPLLVHEALLPMGCFGLLFILGYLGSELTASAFGLSVGFPVSQASVAVAGLISLALREVRGRGPVALFLSSCLAVIAGALGLRLA